MFRIDDAVRGAAMAKLQQPNPSMMLLFGSTPVLSLGSRARDARVKSSAAADVIREAGVASATKDLPTKVGVYCLI
jgi:hypothetical protein